MPAVVLHELNDKAGSAFVFGPDVTDLGQLPCPAILVNLLKVGDEASQVQGNLVRVNLELLLDAFVVQLRKLIFALLDQRCCRSGLNMISPHAEVAGPDVSKLEHTKLVELGVVVPDFAKRTKNPVS